MDVTGSQGVQLGDGNAQINRQPPHCPAAGQQHTVLTVTTRNTLDGYIGQRVRFGPADALADAPTGTR